MSIAENRIEFKSLEEKASCFVTCGKLFSQLFGLNYQLMMVVGAAFVLVYIFLGGFLAESASDFMQGIVMIIALTVIVIVSTVKAGGLSNVIENAKKIPGFLEFFGMANPTADNGVQVAVDAFGEKLPYGILSVFSMLAWGLGYFGTPQVLLRFTATRKEDELMVKMLTIRFL